MIPEKYLGTTQLFARDEFATCIRRSSQVHDREVTMTGSDLTASLPAQSTTPVKSATLPALRTSPAHLPPIPTWAIHILAGSLSFLIVVAVVLYFAQFPPQFTWLRKFQSSAKHRGYTKVKGNGAEDEDISDVWDGSYSTAIHRHPRLPADSETGEGEACTRSRRRRPKHLSIDTHVTYRGLGIAGADGELGDDEGGTLARVLEGRRSYDAEALRERAQSPITAAWESFTAPLPSAKGFLTGQSDVPARPSPMTSGDAEKGFSYTYSAASTPDLLDYRQAYSTPTTSVPRDVGNAEEPPGSAIFRKINDRIYHAADRLSKTFHDQVNGPEEGLLLPVHNEEREPPPWPNVFAV